MRIKVLQTPTETSVDGIDLRRFHVGQIYEVGNSLGALFLAERWAEPAQPDESALLIPFSNFKDKAAESTPPNLAREFFPPYYDTHPVIAADRRRARRRRRARS